ncbi:hypothetical protein H8959_012335 [Pygathrix nigripes]
MSSTSQGLDLETPGPCWQEVGIPGTGLDKNRKLHCPELRSTWKMAVLDEEGICGNRPRIRAQECHRIHNTSPTTSDSPSAPGKRHPDKR